MEIERARHGTFPSPQRQAAKAFDEDITDQIALLPVGKQIIATSLLAIGFFGIVLFYAATTVGYTLLGVAIAIVSFVLLRAMLPKQSQKDENSFSSHT